MLNLKLFTLKKFFKKSETEAPVDLTRASFSFENFPSAVTAVVVTDEFQMRPELIAHYFYGNQDLMCIVLKYNEISNPYSIKTGQILYLPSLENAVSLYKTPDDLIDRGADKSNNEKAFVQPKSKKDQKRLDQLKKNAEVKEILPVNINNTGDSNIKVKDGKIIFGEDVTGVNKDNCPETITRAKLKERLTLNKIFKVCENC